jgi:protein involved in temperature-dependent protein secretion
MAADNSRRRFIFSLLRLAGDSAQADEQAGAAMSVDRRHR